MRPLIIIIIITTFFSCSFSQTTRQAVSIDLSGKQLKSVPDSVFEYKDLISLDLSSDIVFYPPLAALLDSNANQITELPHRLGNLTNLKTLNVSSNRLSELPSSFIKLINLESLDLSFNKELNAVRELDKLKQLPNLKVIKIANTKFSEANVHLIKASLGPEIRVIGTFSEYILKNLNNVLQLTLPFCNSGGVVYVISVLCIT